MNKIIFGLLLILVVGAFGANRTVTTKVIKADTTVKIDTLKKITYDTFLVTKTYKDTIISSLLKVDTTKAEPAHKAKK